MKSINMVCRGNELGRTVRPKENQQDMMNMSSHLSEGVSDEDTSLTNGKLILSEEEAEQLANEIKEWAQKN